MSTKEALLLEYENLSQQLIVAKSSKSSDVSAMNNLLQSRSVITRKLGFPAQAIYDLSQISTEPDQPQVQTLYNLTYALLEAECLQLAEANRATCLEHAKIWGMSEVVKEMEELEKTIQETPAPFPGHDLVRCPRSALPWDIAASENHLYNEENVQLLHEKILAETNGFLGVKMSPGMGRGVIAMRDIPPGTILKDRPLLCSSWKQKKVCAQCPAPLKGKGVVKCRKCPERFCGKLCQKQAMATWHPVLCGKKLESQEWISMTLSYSDSTSDLALPNIIKAFAEAKHKGVSPMELPWVKELTVTNDESDLFIPTNTWAFYTSALELIDAVGDPLFEFWHYTALQQRLHNNSYGNGNMSTGATDTLWRCASFANHSCVNYNASTAGLKLKFTKGVKKGEEVLVSYLNDSETGKERQLMLLKYGIHCDCRLCSKDCER